MGFQQSYRPDNRPSFTREPILDQLDRGAPGFKKFMESHSGCSFNNGIYRVHSVSEIKKWTACCHDAFPSFKGRTYTFASDWLGRQFGLDFNRTEAGQWQVLLFDPVEDESYEIPAGFQEFHDRELVASADAALAIGKYRDWIESGGNVPQVHECVGYKKPLALGGKDEVANMEITDMEVHWSVLGQINAQVRNLPPGTRISGIRISD